MTREEKSQVIEALTAELAQSSNFYLTDLSGLNAVMTSNLRRACFKANVKLSLMAPTPAPTYTPKGPRGKWMGFRMAG